MTIISHTCEFKKRCLNVAHATGPVLRVKNNGHEQLVVLERADHGHLAQVLDEPPQHAVDPDPQRHQAVVAMCQPLHGQFVDGALGPEGGKEGGNQQGKGGGGQQDRTGHGGPEEGVLGAGGEEREEVRDRDLEVYGREDLPVLERRQAEGSKGAVFVVRVQRGPEQQQRGAARDHRKHAGDTEDEGQVPALRGLRRHHLVVADGDQGAVVEEGDEHQHQHRQLEVLGPRLAHLMLVACLASARIVALRGLAADRQHDVAPGIKLLEV
mmetsp:Transcript_92525/g.138635  ORF Transcript_92525/g.138635 Transcript_92525/m.138635 type:complete len:268 (-) Transcript_92525:158-961(-)